MKSSYFKIILLISFIVSITGCSTKYQPTSFSGGYSETRLAENIFNVSFKGNGFTSLEQASDYTFLRSAELSLQNGYEFFVISDSQKNITHTAYTTKPTYNTSFNASSIGNNVYGNAYTTQTGGGTTYIPKPSTNYTIICFKEKPSVEGIVYDARYVVTSIKSKYSIQE